GPPDRRFRVEHAQHLRPEDISLFGKLGVIPSMQPYHAIDDGRWVQQRIGPERIKTTYAFRTLLDTGAKLAFGSDWTVAPLDPIAGIYAGVTRRTLDGKNPHGWVPEQRIRVGEAVRADTAGNAYAAFAGHRRGRLRLEPLAVLGGRVGGAPQLSSELARPLQKHSDREVVGVADHTDRLRRVLDDHDHHRGLEGCPGDPVGRHTVLVAPVLDRERVEPIGEVPEDGFLRGFVHG